jgi:hypothetical protein
VSAWIGKENWGAEAVNDLIYLVAGWKNVNLVLKAVWRHVRRLRNRILAEFEEGVRKLFAVTISSFPGPRWPILGTWYNTCPQI